VYIGPVTWVSHFNPESPVGTVRVLFFAGAREIAGEREIEVSLAEGATVGELRSELVERYPGLGGIAASLSVAVNQEYCGDEVILESSDEVAVIPPVSGG